MSKSNLPNGGYTLTQGSNYMMDGFQFDSEYNGGVLEKARLPEAKGLSALPSGMIPLDSEGHTDLPTGIEMDYDLNLDEITKEAGQDINIVDHSWLASEPEPDLSGERSLEEVFEHLAEGRFENPQVNQLKTLQDAWGSESTTGLDIVPNENRKNRPYQNSYGEQSQLPADDYRQKVEKLHRKLAYGEPMRTVLEAESGDELLDLQSRLASEYGLHGRVYIKEEYFPGLFNGRWNEVINKRCATSMYIIPKSKDCAFDRFLGMEVVKSVPWNRVAKALLPRLETYGVRLASGSTKEVVQRAFIDLIEGRVKSATSSSTWFQIQEDQSDLVSLDHARRVLEASQFEMEYIPTQEEVIETKGSQRLARIASELISQGFLEAEVVESITSSNKTARDKIARLYELASQPTESGVYQGQGETAYYHTASKKKVSTKVESKSSINLKQRTAKAQAKIEKVVKAGLISVEEVLEVAKGKTPEEKVASVLRHISAPKSVKTYNQYDVKEHRMVKSRKMAIEALPCRQKRASANLWKESHAKVDRLLKSGLLSQEDYGHLKDINDPNDFVRKAFDLASKPTEATQYQGEQTAHILGNKKSNTMTETEKKVSTWVRQKMSEGSAGEELDVLIATRFNQNVLDEYGNRVASLRSKHEGLSGHVYVDAEAYMTKGTDGCDKGSLVHRANQIPTLLKTSKCGNCVFNSGGSCQKYNKVIVASVDEVVENPQSFQRENIRLANASDSEKTASLFVNDYDPDEFGLTANGDVLVDEEASNEQIADVLFGGFEV